MATTLTRKYLCADVSQLPPCQENEYDTVMAHWEDLPFKVERMPCPFSSSSGGNNNNNSHHHVVVFWGYLDETTGRTDAIDLIRNPGQDVLVAIDGRNCSGKSVKKINKWLQQSQQSFRHVKLRFRTTNALERQRRQLIQEIERHHNEYFDKVRQLSALRWQELLQQHQHENDVNQKDMLAAAAALQLPTMAGLCSPVAGKPPAAKEDISCLEEEPLFCPSSPDSCLHHHQQQEVQQQPQDDGTVSLKQETSRRESGVCKKKCRSSTKRKLPPPSSCSTATDDAAEHSPPQEEEQEVQKPPQFKRQRSSSHVTHSHRQAFLQQDHANDDDDDEDEIAPPASPTTVAAHRQTVSQEANDDDELVPLAPTTAANTLRPLHQCDV